MKTAIFMVQFHGARRLAPPRRAQRLSAVIWRFTQLGRALGISTE